MNKLDPRRILARPWFYKTFRRMVTTNTGRIGLVEDYLKPHPGDSVLDIGCGTADVLDDLPDVRYFGFNASEEYIDLAARAKADISRASVHEVVSKTSLEPRAFWIHERLGALQPQLKQVAVRAGSFGDRERLVALLWVQRSIPVDNRDSGEDCKREHGGTYREPSPDNSC